MRLWVIGVLVLLLSIAGCIGGDVGEVTTTLPRATTTTLFEPTTTTIVQATTTSIPMADTTTSVTTTTMRYREVDYEALDTMQRLYKQMTASDLIALVNKSEMDRLYGSGYSTRFFETIDRGRSIVNALEAYKDDKGNYPKKLDDLVPGYISAIPKTLIQHKEIRYSPYWKNDANTPEYFEEYQKFWYYPASNLSSYELTFSGPNEYCSAENSVLAVWALNTTDTYPFLCDTQSLLMRLKPLEITQKKETKDFILYTPESWRDNTDEYKPMYLAYYQGEQGFPLRYNNMPLIIVMWVTDSSYTDLEKMKDDWIDGYKTNPDRIFTGKFPTEVTKTKLKSGEDAYVIQVRFYRPSKELNQTRFDMVTVDSKNKKSYNLGISIQYAGDYEKAEKVLQLKELAEDIFTRFELK